MRSTTRPTLWHITVSHYSEKARWALDYKGIPYDGRTPLPGAHMAVALWLTRGRHYTLPAIDIDGERIGDSTASLQRRRPDRRLRARLRPRRGYRWVEEMFRRHRRPSG